MGLKQDRVVIVTGGSRGVGKGVAEALGACGATVYVTGRTLQEGAAPLPGTITATADEVTKRGGTGIAVQCDHRDDAQIKALFTRVMDEQGKLDILVNNVYQVPDDLIEQKPFWERSISHWADMIDLGLRAHYVAACEAAPIMVKQGAGMMVNISSPGARCYIHSPVYGIGKAGADKMMQDMAKELRPHGVAALSLWLGIVLTERTKLAYEAAPEAYAALEAGLETPEYPGRIIDALAARDDMMNWSGKAWYTSELGAEFGVEDANGRIPASYRQMLGGPADPAEAMVQ